MTDSHKSLDRSVGTGDDLLQLARSGSEAALDELSRYSPAELAEAALELAAAERAEFLELSERVDEIVPLLSESDFTNTIRATGIEEAGWLVEFATSEQRVAAVDLDCWKRTRLSPGRLFEWIDAMIEAGPETLVAAFGELDSELWALAMKAMADFAIVGLGEEPQYDSITDDGMVSFDAHSAEHDDRVREILSTAYAYSPSHYWSFVYGAIFESREQCAGYAARWQAGRLNDLGFPDREYAMRAYRPLRPTELRVVDVGPGSGPGDASAGTGATAGADALLPEPLEGSAVGRALRGLSPLRASELSGYILAVANTLAVADELPLAEPESVEASLRKALRGIDRGLQEVAQARGERPSSVLESTAPLDLFRVGATVDPELGRGKTLAEFEEEEERADWNTLIEVIAEADQTLSSNGRVRKEE